MNHTAERVLRAEALKMFEVSNNVWKMWKRRGWVPQGERLGTNVTEPKWYDRAELEALLPELGPVPPEYPDPGDPGVWRVPLVVCATRRKGPRREALIDGEDLGIVQGRRWGWMPGGSSVCMGHVAVCKRGDTTPLHRLILGVEGRDLRVIHLNRDPLDCRRANLEVRSVQGMVVRNRKMKMRAGRPCSSRYKGVCFDKRRGMWVAQIKADRRQRCIGRFDDELEAAQAYDRAAWEAFGPEAFLNFPEDYGQTRDGRALKAPGASTVENRRAA